MLQRLLILVVAVLFVPSLSYASIYGVLEGMVVDSKDGKPLVGATVRLRGTSQGAVAGIGGKFRIVKVEAGTYNVDVTYTGYTDFELTNVTVNPDQTTKIEVQMVAVGVTTDDVVIVADRNVLVKNDQIGTSRAISSDQATSIPRDNIAGAVTRSAGVQAGGSGFNIRGQRAEHTQVRINGFNVNDEFSGAGGAVGLNDQPTISPFATEQVEVVTGGLGAEYGNAIGGVVNTVVKAGRTDRYEGHARWRTNAEALYGKADNGAQAQASNSNTFEFGVGGPIPALDKTTFYISGRYVADEFRGAGLEVYDPIGNNLGQRPDQGSWVRNITGRFDIGLTNDIRLQLGGTYGATSLESSSWQWLYVDDTALFPDGTTNDVPERVAKQAVVNLTLNQLYARMSHTITNSSFYELAFSWNSRRQEINKRKSFDDPTLLGNIELWEPVDEVTIFTNPEGNVVVENQPDRILDNFAETEATTLTEDGLLSGVRPVRNPITGYIEGGENNTGTFNPYGLQQLTTGGNDYFVTHGNQRALDFRTSTYFQVDGNYTSIFDINDFNHTLKAGFELRLFSLERHQNSLPWNDQPFYDIYTSEWGGNFYAEDPDVRELTSQPYEPMDGAIYIQDQIKYKGIIFSPGVRLDFMTPNAEFRTRIDSFVSIVDKVRAPEFFEDSPTRIRVSPRLSVAYPVTDRSNLSLSYTVQYQRPTFNNFYDAFNTDLLRGNQIIGTPNLEPQTVKAYQVAYNGQFTDDMAFDVTAYYRDMFNMTGITYVPATPVPYSVYSVAEYGNSRGIELTYRKLPVNDNIGFSANYTLSQARGTSSATGTNYSLIVTGGTDGFTDSLRTFPLTEYYLSFDIRHRINSSLDLIWRDGEGPTIGGLKVLEHTRLTFTGDYSSGTPYTRLNRAGEQIGEYNGERQPDFWRIDTRIQRDIPLKDLFGESLGNTRLTLFVDVFNITNRTVATGYYARTGSPDNDGNVLDRKVGDFSSVEFYRDADSDPRAARADQYDSFGNRLYNVESDVNLDGVITQEEKFQSYQQFVSDFQSLRGNYQYPRTVSFGLILYF